MAEETRPPPAFIDDPHAPEVFATTAAGFFNLHGSSIVITLETLKSDYATNPGTLSRVVVGRLIMPPHGAHALAVGLFDFLKTQGFDFSAPGDPQSVQ
jgi:hypothetical protein